MTDAATIAALHGVSTATLSMQMLKRGVPSVAMTAIHALDPGLGRLVGPAYTLRFIPRREDITSPAVLADPSFPQRRAIEETPAGHILVADCRGETDAGIVGDIMAERLKLRGVAGVVTDGAVRDADAVRRVGLPVFAGGVAAPPNIFRHHAADVGLPIACGGVAVFPGDVIVADGDGALVLPQAMAAEVAAAGVEQERLESFIQKLIAAGRQLPGTYPPNDETLAEYHRWLEAGEPEEIL